MTDAERRRFKEGELVAAKAIMAGDRYCPDPSVHGSPDWKEAAVRAYRLGIRDGRSGYPESPPLPDDFVATFIEDRRLLEWARDTVLDLIESAPVVARSKVFYAARSNAFSLERAIRRRLADSLPAEKVLPLRKGGLMRGVSEASDE